MRRAAKHLGPAVRGAAVAAALCAGLSGCVPPPQPAFVYQPAAALPLSPAAWSALFAPLAASTGAPMPDVALLQPPDAGAPVLRLTFPDRVFFDTASDVPRPGSAPVLDQLAAALRASPPGTRVTVVGHTDAVGGDLYNLDLSRRRAGGVLAALAARGVDPASLGIVAAGKRQPVAPDDTAEGRERNRRVEILVSGSEAANLALAEQPTRLPPLPEPSQGPAPAPAAPPRRIAAPAAPLRASAPAAPRAPEPAPHYTPNTLEHYQQRDLGPAQTF